MVHAGLYIHIPYCKRKCTYCNFHFSTHFGTKEALLEALHREIAGRREEIPGLLAASIYFGGGTPSVLTAREIESLLHEVYAHYPVMQGAEITLECNPDDLGGAFLDEWREMGVNRLSIGIQSFSDRDLAWMNRAHDSAQSHAAIAKARQCGFENISCDLIFGIPGSGDVQWRDNLHLLFDQGIPHLSCYALTVEDKTALGHHIRSGKIQPVSDEDVTRQMRILFEEMRNHRYDAYEISNYCLPGHRAVHNANYWKGLPYLGFGPSAHSYDGRMRRWNISNNQLYADAVRSGNAYFETEELTRRDMFNEYIMVNLRRSEGIDMEWIRNSFAEYAAATEHELRELTSSPLLMRSGENYMLTDEGKLMSDWVIRNLFQV